MCDDDTCTATGLECFDNGVLSQHPLGLEQMYTNSSANFINIWQYTFHEELALVRLARLLWRRAQMAPRRWAWTRGW